MAIGWYELLKSSNKKVYFVLKAANAEVILTSEMYESRASAENGIHSVQKNSPLDERYESKTTSDGKYFFNLKAANHQVIGSGQRYATEQSRDKGIVSVKTNGPTTTIKDQTKS
ncbi:MAG: YegP family protein [Burkholderiales bacterium]|jgi:uncharacterized protein YegP (UPF0339 family)|nr:YegP family protein [Burkholderiales bacterium]